MQKVIEIKDLVKNYGDNQVIKGIDFTMEKGDFKALLGINGAGKSTTIGILTNLVNKTSGKVYIQGLDIDKDFAQARKKIGVVPQEFNFDLFATVEFICITQAGYYGIPRDIAKKRVETILKKLSLWDKRHAQSRELSGGMKRRLMIARALVHAPEILILDEPTAGVDVELRKSMWDFIQEINKNGTSILLTTHYLEEVEALCNKVAILSKGKIIADTTVTELLSHTKEQNFFINVMDFDKNKISKIPKKYEAKPAGENEILLTLPDKVSLNAMFEELGQAGITATSIRPKENRIEKLFLEYSNN